MNDINFSELLKSAPPITIIKELLKNPDFFIAPFDQDERQHSKEIDKMLGFKIPKVEQKLLKKYRAFYKSADDSNKKAHYQGTQTWIGLHPQVLQTPYNQISHFLSYFKKYNPKTVVDLGAGYGRVGIVMNAILPDATFIGHEILEIRLKEANRIFDIYGLDQCEMRCQNILEDSFDLPSADVYFIYDFSNIDDLMVILKRLSEKLKHDQFFIVAKGEGIRSLIQLKFPEFWTSHGVVHQKEWSLYSSFTDLRKR